tara:strand:+ start:903 stop:1517 length:615 start_codon:yes stop_codon:yes gene_type:complete
MLIFNTNIYARGIPPILPIKYSQPWPGEGCIQIDPYGLILTVLTSDRKIFHDLEQKPLEDSQKKIEVLMPHASRFGNTKTLNFISKRLLEGVVNRKDWLKMNSYHFCYLYDALLGYTEEYSYSSEFDRIRMIPELDGRSIDFNWFLNTYFFNTAFLIEPERFLSIEKVRKEWLGEWSPCLFNAINGLAPTKEEMLLTLYPESPY